MSEVTPDSLMIAGPRQRGRPRVSEADRKVPLTTFVPPEYFERIRKLAAAHGEHLSVYTCKLLGDSLRHFPTD